MKKKKIAKVLALAMVIGISLTSFNSVIAATDEDVTIIISTDGPTNQDVLITIEAADDLSGVKEIVLPDDSRVPESTTTYAATENGVYEFKVYDKAGNLTKGEVEIANIDKEKPVLELVPSTTEPTNQDITITATASDTASGVKKIILPDGTEVEGETAEFIVEESSSYTFKAIDNAGNETEETIEITNIDKVPPVITIEDYNKDWTNEDITVNATVDKGTLNQDSYVFTGNGSFTFIVIDAAGNKAEKTVTITNIDKVRPTMTITVGE